MRFNNIDDWLTWQESLNPKEIDLGLDRVNRVLIQLGLSNTFNCPLITVAGTNGKGSVVAILESLAKTAGLNVCSYTSPHIFQYNERIKIKGLPIDDTVLCEAFERIDQARADQVCGDTALTYFEFGTLAAIDLFFREQPDLIILEVGLGGRLDAVNIMDADVSIITSIAIDHVDWLGDNRELIGYEKAGVFRAGKPVVCGDVNPPQSVVAEAKKKKCVFLLAGHDFNILNDNDHWQLKSSYGDIVHLPTPNLTGEFQKTNAATAMVALQSLQEKKLLAANINLSDVANIALTKINLAGRFQKINNQPQIFVDVAHNPQAASALSSQLKLTSLANGKTWAIIAMLEDKDVLAVLEEVSNDIDYWCFAGLENITRGMSVQALFETLSDSVFRLSKSNKIAEKNQRDLTVNQCTMLSETVLLATNVEKACASVLSKMNDNDRLVIFGSFYTVADAMKYFSALNEHV